MGVAWLAGIFPPIATAFAPDGALRPPAAGFLEYLRDGGLDGVVALGSNGEAAHLTEAERQRYIGSVREALPAPLRLIAGTGAESTRATIERTQGAAGEGGEAALVIAPSYCRRQRPIAPLGDALSSGLRVPGLKAGVRLLGYDHGDPRPPLPPLAASELPALRRLLEDAKLMPRALAS